MRANVALTVYAPPRLGSAMLSFNGLEKPLLLGAGEERSIPVEATVPTVEALGEADAYLGELWVSLGWNRVVKVRNLLFRVGSPAAQEALNRMQTRYLVEGSLSQGEHAESQLSVSEQVSQTRLVLTYSGSDFDLHLYDELGRHVGLNYERGTVDAEVPGVLYSGPQAYPEWMIINTATVKTTV